MPAIRGAQFTLVQFGQEATADDITPVGLGLQIAQQLACGDIEIHYLAIGIEHDNRTRNGIHQFPQMLAHRRGILRILAGMDILLKVADGFI